MRPPPPPPPARDRSVCWVAAVVVAHCARQECGLFWGLQRRAQCAGCVQRACTVARTGRRSVRRRRGGCGVACAHHLLPLCVRGCGVCSCGAPRLRCAGGAARCPSRPNNRLLPQPQTSSGRRDARKTGREQSEQGENTTAATPHPQQSCGLAPSPPAIAPPPSPFGSVRARLPSLPSSFVGRLPSDIFGWHWRGVPGQRAKMR